MIRISRYQAWFFVRCWFISKNSFQLAKVIIYFSITFFKRANNSLLVLIWDSVDLCSFKFSFLYGNVISYLERIRDGKFPHSWLSSHSEKKFPHSQLRRSWGNFLSLFLLSHSWGNYFSCIRGFATHTGKIPSLILSR